MEKFKRVFNELENNSKKPMQNPVVIKDYIKKSLGQSDVITFFNWECPPRFLDNGQVNYLIDLDKIFKGKKIDRFTELPRIVAQKDKEIKILKLLNKLGLKYRFIKIIADTNAYYLTPDSLDRFGQEKIQRAFNQFKIRIKKGLKEYPAKTQAYLFTELIKDYRKLYDKSFEGAYLLLNKEKLLSKNIILQQIKRTREHLGLKDENKIKELSLRTIATYGAEGMVFDKLSKTKVFSNCIWLNIEEVDDRTIAISNCLRRKNKLGPLPMLFL